MVDHLETLLNRYVYVVVLCHRRTQEIFASRSVSFPHDHRPAGRTLSGRMPPVRLCRYRLRGTVLSRSSNVRCMGNR